MLEIGIYSGGSPEMWCDYFGSKAHIYGVDIESACKSYENSMIKVFIGDQADRKFWSQFRREVPMLDLVIDDNRQVALRAGEHRSSPMPSESPGPSSAVVSNIVGRAHLCSIDSRSDRTAVFLPVRCRSPGTYVAKPTALNRGRAFGQAAARADWQFA